MMRICQILVLGLLAGSIMSCGVSERSVTRPPATLRRSNKKPVPQRPPTALLVTKTNEVKASLEQAYRDWKGTPYVLGGHSSKGIDCSALMQRIFRQYFGIKIPRNTKRQLYAGQGVRRDGLSTGDLVFFKTGRKTLHVGVIVKGDQFLHASTSQGVTTSSLDNYYWKSRYLAARRVMQLR